MQNDNIIINGGAAKDYCEKCFGIKPNCGNI